eukprot:508268_1
MEIGTEIIKCIESIVGCICGGVRIGFGPCDECKLILLFGHIMSFISIHRQWLWFVPLDVRQQPLAISITALSPSISSSFCQCLCIYCVRMQSFLVGLQPLHGGVCFIGLHCRDNSIYLIPKL